MKKVILSFLVVFVAIAANAQNLYLGGSFGILHDDNADVTQFSIAPEIGYNFNERWAVGGEISYTHMKYDGDIKGNSFSIAPYARFSFYENDLIRLFIDGQVGFSTTKVDGTESENGFEIGFKPGIAFRLCDHFSAIAKYGFLGYRDEYRGSSVSGVALSSEDLSIGFLYEF